MYRPSPCSAIALTRQRWIDVLISNELGARIGRFRASSTGWIWVTEFVACVLCKVMFHVPAARPPDDGGASLKRDAALAALDYRKPGRHKPRRPGRRRTPVRR